MSEASKQDRPGDGSALYQAAADWHTKLDSECLSAADRVAFQDWINADRAHRTAFEAVDGACAMLRDAKVDPRVMTLRAEALGASRRRSRLRYSRAAAASILVLASCASLLALPHRSQIKFFLEELFGGESTYRTALGERGSLVLSDGSAVLIDSNSRLRVVYSKSARRVRLDRGQAWFRVAKVADRPFIVEADGRQITALGTEFDVKLGERQGILQVTLAEGRIKVQPLESAFTPLLGNLLGGPETAHELSPGESLRFAPRTPARQTRADLTKIASWRDGKLIFDDDSLATAIAEVNRYSSRRIVLRERDLSSSRISGVFKAGHIDSFIDAVTDHFSLRAIETPGGDIVLERKNN